MDASRDSPGVEDGLTLDQRRAAFRGFLPAIERLRRVRQVEWSGGGQREDGVFTLAYPQYDEDTLEVMEAFGGGALTAYGYVETLERRGLAGRPLDLMALARDSDEEFTLALLTGLIRSERFGDGSVAAALQDGTLVALIDRLRELYDM